MTRETVECSRDFGISNQREAEARWALEDPIRGEIILEAELGYKVSTLVPLSVCPTEAVRVKFGA